MFIPELRRLQDILTSFLGQPKSDMTDNGQLQYNCPRCIDDKGSGEIGKYNLEVNIFKGVFMCWSCCSLDTEMKGPIKKLILKYGGRSAYDEYERVISDIRSNKLYSLPEFKEMLAFTEENYLHLPLTYKPINLKTAPNRVREYLENRKITQDIIDRYKLGYTTYDEERAIDRNRIIIPSYGIDDSLNYWVGRDFTNNKKRQKYNNCNGVKKTDIVFNEKLIEYDADIVLVEGIIDSIYLPNTIPLMGKILTKNDYLYNALMEKANGDVTIILDADTKIEETKNIYKLLNKGRLKNKIWYVRLSELKDFGEIYEKHKKKGIIETINKKQQFSEFDLVW